MRAPCRILVVDDSAEVRHLLARVLTRAGYEVRTADSPSDAISGFDDGPADLVLTDFVGAAGVRFWEWLHAEHPELPVVFVSGSDQHALSHDRDIVGKIEAALGGTQREPRALRLARGTDVGQ